ncbi:acyl-CoA dehydrogenase family member 11-like isoform X2 [Limulus polyphemus]|uniref:Acyl-CoA dehydrogenase family member 11-like isoform X2 n=1 Tax=Limulus polyphemus TaxID=6850 RepID=A0ABM1BA95_LIMPO|nr:acyl-CoA dehydrogenase family member 11-like isoform X2 [Limulus polyphemus]
MLLLWSKKTHFFRKLFVNFNTCFPPSTLTVFRKLCSEIESNFSKSTSLSFSAAKHGSFYQTPPKLSNQYLEDTSLLRYLKRTLPQEVFEKVNKDLLEFGEAIVANIDQLSKQCEALPPQLIIYNAWGKREEKLWTCDAWKKMHNLSAKEGLVAIGYERKFGEFSRLYQMAKLYLYAPSSGLYTCPLAMTDGAAKTIETLGLTHPVFVAAYSRLVSRDPKFFWTSGQWMTERQGGSDVAGGTETVAFPQNDGTFRLFGYKWFSSATDANIALTLARIADSQGQVIQGTKGLTMFYLETCLPEGGLNNLEMVQLKEKLGTRQLPTAELLLKGTVAYRMSEAGRGVAEISNMLSMTRIHNAIAAVASMRRILNLARDYSFKRIAFGKLIINHPLHMHILASLETEVRGSLLFLLEIIHWLGKLENGKATDTETLLFRMLTPVLKLFTAKQAVAVVSEGLEAFGGQGYMENTGLPGILRDVQVLPIWEGTTNILSLDVLRSISRSNKEVLKAYYHDILERTEMAKSIEYLKESYAMVIGSLNTVLQFVQINPDKLEVAARDFAYSLARVFIV